MIVTKTINLCDGITVTIRRRNWSEACESTFAHMDASRAIEESDKSTAEKAIEALRLDIAFRTKPLELYVEEWEKVKPLLSQAGFNQLERELAEFSKSEVVEGN